MVIEIDKEFLIGLYEKNEIEFENIISLIKRNINDGINLGITESNFIYLEDEAYEYLKDYIKDRSFEEYGNNITFIKTYVRKIEKYKIVMNKIIDTKLEIQYEFGLLKYLLTSCPIVVTENINDKKIYQCILNSFSKYKLKQEYQNGNGSQVPLTLKDNLNDGKISAVITDRDEKYKGEINRSSTPSKVKEMIYELTKEKKNNKLYLHHIIINYKNIEGLIPYRCIIENLSDKTKNHFDEMYKMQKDKEWLKYFDFKKGINKNLKNDKKNFIEDSVEWWKNQFNLKEDFKDFIESRVANTKDILISGISSCCLNNLEQNDFKEKSSEEQKKEYIRLVNLIEPLLIVNYYEVQ